MCFTWFQKTSVFGVTLGREVLWLNIFYCALCFQKLLFQLFPTSFTWLAVVDLPFIFLSLPPPIIRYSNFTIRFWKLSRRSTMTRPWQEHSCKRLSKRKVGEPTAAADQKNLTTKVSITNIVAKVENDWRESVMKLAQRPQCVS
jgi:hypothetical protein